MEFYDFPIILDTSSSQLTPSFFRLGLAATTNQILWTLYSADQRTFTPRLRVVVIATGSHVEHLAAERFNSCENLYHFIHRWDPVCQMCWWFKKTPHKWWVISPSSWVVPFCWDMDHHCWGFTRKTSWSFNGSCHPRINMVSGLVVSNLLFHTILGWLADMNHDFWDGLPSGNLLHSYRKILKMAIDRWFTLIYLQKTSKNVAFPWLS